MGRAKKTEAEKDLEGNRSKRLIPSELGIEIPKRCPSTFTPSMRKVWKRIAPQLIKVGKLTKLNVDGFTELCYLIITINEIREFIEDNNRSRLQEKKWTDFKGTDHIDLKESAYSKMYRDYSKQLLSYLSKYGLTPDKMAGSYKPKKKEDPMEGMLD